MHHNLGAPPSLEARQCPPALDLPASTSFNLYRRRYGAAYHILTYYLPQSDGAYLPCLPTASLPATCCLDCLNFSTYLLPLPPASLVRR